MLVSPVRGLRSPSATASRRAGAARRWARTLRRYRFAYLLILPTVLAMLAIHFIPMIIGGWMSLLDLNQFTLSRFLRAPFVGLHNYIDILTNPQNPMKAGLSLAARNTLLYAILVNAGTLGFGLITALLLNRNLPGSSIARTILLLPWVVPSYVVGLLWGFMWLRDTGIINHILIDLLHLASSRPFWLIGPAALWAIVIPTIWRSFPFNMVTFLAALQTIPRDFYEAADIDGASSWQRFRLITLPLLRPVVAVMLLYGMVTSIYSYNIVAMMFGNGAGYAGEWGDLMMTALTRQSFGYWQFGMGAAASVLLMIGTLIVVVVWQWIFRNDLTVE